MMALQQETRGPSVQTDGTEPSRHPVRHRTPETKTFIGTSEFWVAMAGIAALVVIWAWNKPGSLDAWRACLLGTILLSTYVASRGIAKAGTRRDERMDRDSTYDA
jgi:hypothetical protein